MLKFAVLLADAFQDSEYFLPKVEVEKLGIETETISLSTTPVEVFSFFKSIGYLKIDKAIDEADVRDYIGTLVPGGTKSPEILAEDERILSFLRDLNSAEKLIAPICRGTLLVATSGVAKGREITGFHLASQYQELPIKSVVEDYGGRWREDKPVVIDNNLISSRHPNDIPYFIEAIRKWLKRRRLSQLFEEIQYSY